MKDIEEKQKVEDSLNMSVPSGTYETQGPQGCQRSQPADTGG